MNKQSIIMAAIGIVVVVGIVAAAKWAQVSSQQSADQGGSTAERLIRSDSQTKGSANAKVTVVEFGDYQCPSCGALEPTMEQLEGQYPANQVRWVFRNFPLSQHQHALEAAQAAEAAGLQGKFWEMHNKLYASQNQWADAISVGSTYDGFAKDLGLNVSQFQKDKNSDQIKQKVQRDLADATALNLQGTPSLFINGSAYNGNYDAASLKAAIDAKLK